MSYYAAARAKYPRDAYQAGDKVQLADGFTYVVDAVDNGDSDSSDQLVIRSLQRALRSFAHEAY